MPYKTVCIPKQRGAVLIFSLIMLLLLTLVSVGMIQQNKQELAMTGNVLQQTKTLANAETQLKTAEQIIDRTRYALANLGDAIRSDRKCDNTHSITKTSTVGSSTVTAVYCLKDNTVTECLSGDLNDGSSAACQCPQLSGTEIYTLTLTLTDNNSGSQRTVESKYAVDCSGGTF